MGAALAAKKKDWQYSKYACPTKRSIGTECIGKITSDPIIGEFVFKGKVKSVRGRTVALGNNRYRFSAENVDCDILH